MLYKIPPAEVVRLARVAHSPRHVHGGSFPPGLWLSPELSERTELPSAHPSRANQAFPSVLPEGLARPDPARSRRWRQLRHLTRLPHPELLIVYPPQTDF